jgi:hypothetical protein
MPFIIMKCLFCDCTLKSSHAILTHLNTKKHQRICKDRGVDNIADLRLFTPIDPSYLERIDWEDYVKQVLAKALSPIKDKPRPIFLDTAKPFVLSEVPIAKTVEATPPSGVVDLSKCMGVGSAMCIRHMEGFKPPVLSVSEPLAVHNIVKRPSPNICITRTSS